jgi:hypothetical protein
MKKIIYTSLAIATIGLSSCSLNLPVMVTDNPVGTKTGESSYKVFIFGIREFNADRSIATAAKNGGITKVATVDQKVSGKMFSTKYSTIVTGE